MMRRFCLGIFLFAVLIVGAIAAVLAWIILAGEPNEIRAHATFDRAVIPAGDVFTLTVELENVDLDPVVIDAVGLDDELLSGARVVDVQPVYRAADERDFPLLGEWTEYSLNQRLLGGNQMTVTITFEAIVPGAYSGVVSVWIEGDLLGMNTSRARRETVEYRIQ